LLSRSARGSEAALLGLHLRYARVLGLGHGNTDRRGRLCHAHFVHQHANHINHSIYADDFGTSVEATPNINGFSFRVVLAPGSLVALMLCGLAAPRWRR